MAIFPADDFIFSNIRAKMLDHFCGTFPINIKAFRACLISFMKSFKDSLLTFHRYRVEPIFSQPRRKSSYIGKSTTLRAPTCFAMAAAMAPNGACAVH